jgi:hypothetical protein
MARPRSRVLRFVPDEAHSPSAKDNTELFFHLPLYMACAHMRNQRFSDAQAWFHHRPHTG